MWGPNSESYNYQMLDAEHPFAHPFEGPKSQHAGCSTMQQRRTSRLAFSSSSACMRPARLVIQTFTNHRSIRRIITFVIFSRVLSFDTEHYKIAFVDANIGINRKTQNPLHIRWNWNICHLSNLKRNIPSNKLYGDKRPNKTGVFQFQLVFSDW